MKTRVLELHRDNPPVAPVDSRYGVWDADAPDGYVALVAYGKNGRRLLRLEMAQDVYSQEWIATLETWLADHETVPPPRIVR
jgi:hypothetical protein